MTAHNFCNKCLHRENGPAATDTIYCIS